MKNLRIAVLSLVLTSTMLVANALPVSKVRNYEEAKVELYSTFKSNLTKWNAINYLGLNNSANFIVYCKVDDNGKVEVMKVIGQNQVLKDKIICTMEKHPIHASDLLKGESLNFKLSFINNQ